MSNWQPLAWTLSISQLGVHFDLSYTAVKFPDCSVRGRDGITVISQRRTDRSINSWQNIQNRFCSGSCHNRCFQDHVSPWWQRHISANYFYQALSGVLNYTHYSKQQGSECNILHKHKNLQTHRDCPLTGVNPVWQHLQCVFVVWGLGSVNCAPLHDSTLRLFVRVWDWLQGVYKEERVGMLFSLSWR